MSLRVTQLCQVTSWVQVHAQPNQRTSLGQSTTPPSAPNGRVECQPHHSLSLLCSRSRWLRSGGRSYPTGCGRGGTAGLPELNNIRNPIATSKAHCVPKASVEEGHPFVEASLFPQGKRCPGGRSYPTWCGRGGTSGLPMLNNIRNPIATGRSQLLSQGKR